MSSTPEVQTNGAATNGTTPTTTTTTPVTFSSFKPKLVVEAPKAADAVAFYKAAFGVEEVGRVMHSKRKADQELPLILSAHLKFSADSSVFSVSDFAEDTLLVKNDGAAAGVVFTLETEDVAGAVANAVGAGAVAEGEISEQEGTGCVVAKLKDPYGYLWIISSASPAKVSDAPVADAQAA